MREKIIEKIEQEKVIAIVRGVGAEQCLKVAQALYDGGVHMLEVTFAQNNPDSFVETARAIHEIAEQFSGRMEIGAGTVTTPKLVEMAAEAGAKYIISPDTNVEVIRRTLDLGLVSLPGAVTPSEILVAHNAGADFVKVFPAGSFGPDYIKAVRAPLSHVKLLAVGGVNEKNAVDFLKAGAVGLGVGGNLVSAKAIAAGEFEKLTQVAKELMKAVQSV